MDPEDGARRPRWWRVGGGAALVLAPLLVLVRTWPAIRDGNPSYPLALAVSAALGLWLVVSGLRATTPPHGGRARTALRVLAALAAVGLAATVVWLEPLVATQRAVAALRSDAAVTVTDAWMETTYESTAPPRAGLVLYPGAKVDPRAYAVLAHAIAARGFRVVVPKCPFDIELLCRGRAHRYVNDEIPWAVGGHSLGGVAASEYAGGNRDIEGVVLWGAYPLADLSGRTDLQVASVTGSNDGLSTPSEIAEHRHLLPPGTTYTEIDGGTHAYFGDYGKQPGDGTATVDRAVAQQQVVDATSALLDRISATNAAAS